MPTKQGAGAGAGDFLQRGQEVEVRSHEDGFRGAWFEAVIVRRIRGRSRFAVRYVSLVSEEDQSEPVQEVVSLSNVRPRPPPPPAGGDQYHLHDPVEAYQNDGWWCGIVSGVPLLPDTSRYTVSFPTTREVIQFEHSDLRPQLHWVKSRWVPAKEMDQQQKHTFNVGDHVEVIRHQEDYGEAWLDAVIIKVFDKDTFLVEHENVKIDNTNERLKEILSNDYVRPGMRGVPLVKHFDPGDEVDALHNSAWLPGTLLEALEEGKYLIELNHTKLKLKLDCAEMRHQRVRRGSCWVYKNKKLLDIGGMMSPKRKKMLGKSSSFPILLSDSSDEGEVAHESQGLEIENYTPAPIVENESSRDEQHISKSPSHRIVDTSNPSTSDFHLIHNVSNKNDVSQLVSGNNEFSFLSYDGSRHEAKTKESNNDLPVVENCGRLPISKGLMASKVTVGRIRKKLVSGPPKRRKMTVNVDLRTQSQNEVTLKEGNVPPKKYITYMRGPKRCEAENFEMSLDEVVGICDNRQKADLNHSLLEGNSSSICLKKEVLESSSLLLGNPSDLICNANLPASDETNNSTTGKQVGVMRDVGLTSDVESLVSNSTSVNCSKLEPSHQVRSCPIKTKQTVPSKFCNSPRDAIISAENQNFVSPPHGDNSSSHEDLTQTRSPSKGTTVEKGRPLFDPSPNSSCLNKVTLPFVKSSVLWELIETMDVFRQLPQEPHFRPLEKYHVEFREGMAIGLMVSFANLASNALKLSISDNQNIIEEMLRALEDSEANGFHVASLRMRLKELLQIQVSWRESRTRKTMLEEKMLDMKDEINNRDSIITLYDETIGGLEESLAILHIHKDRLLAEKEKYESEIRKAQEAVDAIPSPKN